MPKRLRDLKGDMIRKSGVPNWILETLLWSGKRDLQGKHKVTDRWEKDDYEVISKKPRWNPSICHKEFREKWERNTMQEHVVSFEFPSSK